MIKKVVTVLEYDDDVIKLSEEAIEIPGVVVAFYQESQVETVIAKWLMEMPLISLNNIQHELAKHGIELSIGTGAVETVEIQRQRW